MLHDLTHIPLKQNESKYLIVNWSRSPLIVKWTVPCSGVRQEAHCFRLTYIGSALSRYTKLLLVRVSLLTRYLVKLRQCSLIVWTGRETKLLFGPPGGSSLTYQTKADWFNSSLLRALTALPLSSADSNKRHWSRYSKPILFKMKLLFPAVKRNKTPTKLVNSDDCRPRKNIFRCETMHYHQSLTTTLHSLYPVPTL